jgi:hypothetical protein
MRFKNGREAKVGDLVFGINKYTGVPFSGIIGAAHEHGVTVYPLRATDGISALSEELSHIDDITTKNHKE